MQEVLFLRQMLSVCSRIFARGRLTKRLMRYLMVETTICPTSHVSHVDEPYTLQIDRNGRVIDFQKQKGKLHIIEQEFKQAERIEYWKQKEVSGIPRFTLTREMVSKTEELCTVVLRHLCGCVCIEFLNLLLLGLQSTGCFCANASVPEVERGKEELHMLQPVFWKVGFHSWKRSRRASRCSWREQE